MVLEAQTLACLQHPGIAQVHDAGFFDAATGALLPEAEKANTNARPFFAMEYVRGVSLTAYAKQAELDTTGRLELMIRVCEAVQHAHSKGVIHRDLKPANILVDESGQPKILDFGVARVTDPEVKRITIETNLGELMGTIPYMSPEQVRADPALLDTRSDVYALGVILFELLAGRLPYDLDRKMIHDAIRIISEEPPTQLGTLKDVYRGDVETIAAKALEKEKDRRYPTASALAEDIQRHLSDEPIIARPPSGAYLLHKFARRNKALVGGVVVSMILLTLGIVATTYLAIRATDAKREARREATRATAVVGFLQETFTAASPSQDGREVRVADTLDRASANVELKFPDDPRTAAEVRRAIAETYYGLGLYEEAATEWERVQGDLTSQLGADHDETVGARGELAWVYSRLSRFEEAETLLLDTLERRERTLGSSHENTRATMLSLAANYADQGKLDEALATYHRRHAATIAALGPKALDSIMNTHGIVATLLQLERPREAEEMLRTLEATVLENFEEHDVQRTVLSQTLGEFYRQTMEFNAAAEEDARTLAAFETRYGPEHAIFLEQQTNLGRDLQLGGRLDEAEAILADNIVALEENLGPDHFSTLTATAFLAEVHIARGDHDRAASMHEAVVAGRARSIGPDHPQTLISMNNQAFALSEGGRWGRATKIYVDLLERRIRVFGREHTEVAATYRFMGVNEAYAKNNALSEEHLRNAVEIYTKLVPADDTRLLDAHSNLAVPIYRGERYEEAEAHVLEGAKLVDMPDAPIFSRSISVRRAIHLYTIWDKPEEAAMWTDRHNALVEEYTQSQAAGQQ